MHKIVSSVVLTALAGSLVLAWPVHAANNTHAATVKEGPLRGHLSFLASDALEGRGTGQRGGELTVAYLESQAMAVGLQPANGGSYRQEVTIAGVRTLPQQSNVGVYAGGQALPMAFGAGQGSELWQPMGVSVIGGLTVSTILTLLLVPVLYCSFAGVGIKRQRRKLRRMREMDDYYQAHKHLVTKPKD